MGPLLCLLYHLIHFLPSYLPLPLTCIHSSTTHSTTATLLGFLVPTFCIFPTWDFITTHSCISGICLPTTCLPFLVFPLHFHLPPVLILPRLCILSIYHAYHPLFLPFFILHIVPNGILPSCSVPVGFFILPFPISFLLYHFISPPCSFHTAISLPGTPHHSMHFSSWDFFSLFHHYHSHLPTLPSHHLVPLDLHSYSSPGLPSVLPVPPQVHRSGSLQFWFLLGLVPATTGTTFWDCFVPFCYTPPHSSILP